MTARLCAVVAIAVAVGGCGESGGSVGDAFGGLTARDTRAWIRTSHDNDRVAAHFFAMIGATREGRLEDARREARAGLRAVGAAEAHIARIRNPDARRAFTELVGGRASYIRAWDRYVAFLEQRRAGAARSPKPVMARLRRAADTMSGMERRFLARIKSFMNERERAAFRRKLGAYKRDYSAALGDWAR